MRQSFETQPALFAPHEMFDHPALAALDAVEGLIDWTRIEALLPQGEAERCQRAPKSPRMWASKIPWLAGGGIGDQPAS